MIERAEIASQTVHNSEGKVATNQAPFTVDGTIFIPASEMAAGIVTRDDNGKLVQLHLCGETMIGNRLALFVRLTPDGARELANHLIRNAVQVDAYVRDQSNLLIEAARKAPPAGDKA